MKKAILLLTMGLIVLLTACGNNQKVSETSVPTTQPITTASTVSQETVQPTTTPVSTQTQSTAASVNTEVPQDETKHAEPPQEEPQVEEQPQEEQNMTLKMAIGNTPVSVAWEDNDAVEALKEMCRNGALTISMSMYGGFEQVGSIGTDLPANDVQTTTSAGDIVLYSGNQIVVFYGSNTWAYTRLGHITDQSTDGISQLLSNGDTTVTINLE